MLCLCNEAKKLYITLAEIDFLTAVFSHDILLLHAMESDLQMFGHRSSHEESITRYSCRIFFREITKSLFEFKYPVFVVAMLQLHI